MRRIQIQALGLVVSGLLLFGTTSFAEDKKPTPVAQDIQVKLLKKQHAVDAVNNKMADLQSRWTQVQDAARQLQAEFTKAKDALDAANKELETEKSAAFKSANMDDKAFALNVETGTFDPKTSPAPPTPSPDKK